MLRAKYEWLVKLFAGRKTVKILRVSVTVMTVILLRIYPVSYIRYISIRIGGVQTGRVALRLALIRKCSNKTKQHEDFINPKMMT